MEISLCNINRPTKNSTALRTYFKWCFAWSDFGVTQICNTKINIPVSFIHKGFPQSTFSFDQIYYEQCDGVLIGSCVPSQFFKDLSLKFESYIFIVIM